MNTENQEQFNYVALSGRLIKIFNKTFDSGTFLQSGVLAHDKRTKNGYTVDHYNIEAWNLDLREYLNKIVTVQGKLVQNKYENQNSEIVYKNKVEINHCQFCYGDKYENVLCIRGIVSKIFELTKEKGVFLLDHIFSKKNKEGLYEKKSATYKVVKWDNVPEIFENSVIDIKGVMCQFQKDEKLHFNINAVELKLIKVIENKNNHKNQLSI